MKTYKEFRLGLEEDSLIRRETHKGSQEYIDDKKEQAEKEKAGSALSDKNMEKQNNIMRSPEPNTMSSEKPVMKSKKKDLSLGEEKEANAENCSNLPADEKKKERQMDIEKINKKIKPHHKKIVAKKK